ncbi:MAG TPA: tRNA pseudouridine(55) synthase TruB [Bryobacteraceae bacterium]|jgi:tRNA pseudouridine55 synthase|nr:tRNA pseudouridine(55) synthase TruB [Bryobacteraceae bacterium]
MNGVVLIDKPSGCTSHDVVNRWRKLAGTKRAGHLGTLDPMARGLLVLVTGTATRLAQYFDKAKKTYIAEILLGSVSNTYDADGETEPSGIAPPADASVIVDALDAFRGTFLQVPPPVSAKKVAGVRAYKLARQNVQVALKPVEVNISDLDVLDVNPPKVSIRVTCSAGTYIRSLAHDLGQRLGCGGLLAALRRTGVGHFNVADSRTLDELADLASAGRISEAILSSSSLLPTMPSQYVDMVTESQIRQGREFRTSPFVVEPGAPMVKALSQTSGELIAIGELKLPNVYHPTTVV